MKLVFFGTLGTVVHSTHIGLYSEVRRAHLDYNPQVSTHPRYFVNSLQVVRVYCYVRYVASSVGHGLSAVPNPVASSPL